MDIFMFGFIMCRGEKKNHKQPSVKTNRREGAVEKNALKHLVSTVNEEIPVVVGI